MVLFRRLLMSWQGHYATNILIELDNAIYSNRKEQTDKIFEWYTNEFLEKLGE